MTRGPGVHSGSREAFKLVDGSVHFVGDAVDLETWRALSSIASGDQPPAL